MKTPVYQGFSYLYILYMDQMDIIEGIISSPNRMRESYVGRHHPELYDFIISYNNLDIPFKEKLWYYYNKIGSEVICRCGNRTTFNKNFKDGYKKYCSTKCAQSDIDTKNRRKQTVLQKYGVDNVAKSQEVKDKTEQTNIERYGYKSSFQNTEVREKWKKTIKGRYGVEHTFQSEEIKQSIKETMIERYGKHYTKTDEYIKKTLKTNNKKVDI